MAQIRVGGVPEHFNLPWQMASERGLFDKHGVKACFSIYFFGFSQVQTHLLYQKNPSNANLETLT